MCLHWPSYLLTYIFGICIVVSGSQAARERIAPTLVIVALASSDNPMGVETKRVCRSKHTQKVKLRIRALLNALLKAHFAAYTNGACRWIDLVSNREDLQWFAWKHHPVKKVCCRNKRSLPPTHGYSSIYMQFSRFSSKRRSCLHMCC